MNLEFNTPITFTDPTIRFNDTPITTSVFKVTHNGSTLLGVPDGSHMIVGKPPLRTLLRHILLRLAGR